MTNLSERYVWAAIRSVPEPQRVALEPELRGRVADAVAAQRAAGVADEDAETIALIALGDPERLAAGYTKRRLYLIGPRYYLDYLRLLRLLLAIVVPVVFLATAFGQALSGHGPLETGGTAFGVALQVGLQLAFWVTLAFAIIDRTTDRRDAPLVRWTPDHLPKLPTRERFGLGELIPSIVFLVFFGTAILWQQSVSFFTDVAGDPIPVLNPDLWSFWLPWFLSIILLDLIFTVLLYVRGYWTMLFASINLALNVAFAVPAVWLFTTGQLINPAFLEAMGWPVADIPTVATVTVLVALFVGITLWDSVDGYRKAWLNARAK
jgi:hypothetical protein